MANLKNKKDYQYFSEVMEHKKSVMDIMYDFSIMLQRRGYTHDDSKIQDEFDLWTEHYIPENERDVESDEYKKAYGQLEDVRKQHYLKNRHHIEFHNNDIKKMNIIDLLEMTADWIASASAQDRGNLRITIEKAREKYKFSKEVEALILNTLELVETIKDIK